MAWCFAKINGRLAEIYFDKRKGRVHFRGHCYVTEDEFPTKKEKQMIKDDIEQHRFSYRNKKYRHLV